MKKRLFIFLAALLAMAVLTACKAPASERGVQNSVPGKVSDSGVNLSVTPANAPESTAVSSAAAAYEKLTAFKTENYSQKSVAEFNRMLAATPDDLRAYSESFTE